MTARNLLIVTLDSVRADYFRGPVLDRLIAAGTYFSQAITCAPSTPESHAAMFSGCYPPIHGLRNHHGRTNDRTPHLLEIAEDAGFDVAACTPLASMPARVVGGADDIAAAVHELRDWRAPGRHALFFHVWRTHYPYLLRSPALRSQAPSAIMEGLRDPQLRPMILSGYERALRCAEDEIIARLEETLRRARAWDDTLVVIWSDHGEAFGAGGEPFHGYTLVDETLRVPLLLLGPGVPPGLVIDSQVRTIDIAPTVLELLGIDFAHRFFWRPEGESLVPWLADSARRVHRPAYAECCAGGKSIGLGEPFDVPREAGAIRRAYGFRYAVRMPPWKLVDGAGGAHLYDLERADAEAEAVVSVAGVTVADAKAVLADTLLGVDATTTPSAGPPGGRALLESLGYIDDAPSPPAPDAAVDTLEDGDGIYPSYDLLWPTATGHLAAPRFRHHQTKHGHCELGAEQLYLLGLARDGCTLRTALAELATRLARADSELLRVFPQFALDGSQLAKTIDRLHRQGFLSDGALAAGVVFDLVESTLARPGDRLVAQLDGLEAVAIEQLLAGATADEALAHARDHARDRLCQEAREVLALAAKRHLLRVRKAEQPPR